MLFRRHTDRLRRCPICRSPLACPMTWEASDDEHWTIHLRCGDCGHCWDAVIDDRRAARYDAELDGDIAVIERALERLDLARMAVEADAFADALSRDLIEPADFVA